MQPTKPGARLPRGAASPPPCPSVHPPASPPPSAWAQNRQWAEEVTLATAATTFRWALMPPHLLDAVAGQAVGQLAETVAIGPALCAGVSCGVAAALLGQDFPQGFEAGHALGTCTAQVLFEAPYRLTMFGLIACAAGASITVGAAAGLLALSGGTALVVSERACSAVFPASARALLDPFEEAFDAGDGRFGKNPVA